jgi:hypothetical protein
MNHYLRLCSIKIPTVIYHDCDNTDGFENYPYIKFEVSSPEIDNHLEYLALDEAQKITEWLGESINYIENIEESESLSIYPHSGMIKVLTLEQLDVGRLWLVGQLTVETDNKIEPSILVDVVQNDNNVWIRLIVINDVILSCWFSVATTRELINGLSSAITQLNQNPPCIISNFYIGKLEVLTDDAQSRWINIEIEGAVEQSDVRPNIMLNILDSEDGKGFSSIWWFNDDEASQLSQILAESLIAVEEKRLEQVENEDRVIGYLGESEARYWLKVTVSQNLSSQSTTCWINLRFDDELVRENHCGWLVN